LAASPNANTTRPAKSKIVFIPLFKVNVIIQPLLVSAAVRKTKEGG